MVGKKKLIGNVNNIGSYIVSHDSTNVLCRGPLGLNIVNKVRFIGEKAKTHASRYLNTMEESINPVFYARVLIECVAVEVVEFRDVPL